MKELLNEVLDFSIEHWIFTLICIGTFFSLCCLRIHIFIGKHFNDEQ